MKKHLPQKQQRVVGGIMMTKKMPSASACYLWLALSCILLLLLAPTQTEAFIRMKFNDRPNVEDRQCRSEQVQRRHRVKLHYNASIDASSEVGIAGQEVENTRTVRGSPTIGGTPIEIIVGVGQTGWDQALTMLCVGDRATLIVTAPDAPYGIERFHDNVPRGAIVRVTIEIISTEASTDVKLRDHDSYLFSSADKNNDKQLSQREFLFYFKDKKARIGSPQYRQVLKELGELFNDCDHNDDKVLTLDEFTFHRTSVHAHTQISPNDEFDFYDDNHDGKLNKKEIEGYFKAIKMSHVPMDYWKHMDVNRNGYISFEEFTQDAFKKYLDRDEL